VNFQRAIFVVYYEESSIWANFHRDSPQAAGWDTIECAGILIRRGVRDPEYSTNIYQGQPLPTILKRHAHHRVFMSAERTHFLAGGAIQDSDHAVPASRTK